MIKKALLSFLVLLCLTISAAFFLPGKIQITKSIIINAPIGYVFEEINDLKRWKAWSYPQVHDPTMQVEYNSKSGTGAGFSWTSSDGKGSVIVTQIHGDSLINLEMNGSDSAKSYYKLKPENDGTVLTTGLELSKIFRNPVKKLFAFIFTSPKHKSAIKFELEKIKEIAEAKPIFTISISEESLAPTYYISVSGKMNSTNPEKIISQTKSMFEEIQSIMDAQNVAPSDKPFCLIDVETEKRICAMPINPESKFPPEYPVSQHYSGSAIRGVHIGSYKSINDTHAQLRQYLEYKKFEMNGMPWEIYVKNPGNTFDSKELVVEVYYPVK